MAETNPMRILPAYLKRSDSAKRETKNPIVRQPAQAAERLPAPPVPAVHNKRGRVLPSLPAFACHCVVRPASRPIWLPLPHRLARRYGNASTCLRAARPQDPPCADTRDAGKSWAGPAAEFPQSNTRTLRVLPSGSASASASSPRARQKVSPDRPVWNCGSFLNYIRIDKYEYAEYICLDECEKAKMDTKSLVQEKYGAAARQVSEASNAACCNPGFHCCDPITTNLYNEAEKSGLPAKAVLASLGCGNPTALIELRPGETVLDLGSGGGIDVLLSARRVGPTGKAYGLDMTDDMLALARENQRQAGVDNVEFLKGEIENIPLPDGSVDVVISNCVINLSGDKSRVLREAFRVLRPGGRFAVSDVIVRGQVPEAVRQSMLLWVGCIAGALEENDYVAKLLAAGFTDVDLEPTRTYDVEDARVFLTEAGIAVDEIASQVQGKFLSALIRATKPVEACCEAGCCSTA